MFLEHPTEFTYQTFIFTLTQTERKALLVLNFASMSIDTPFNFEKSGRGTFPSSFINFFRKPTWLLSSYILLVSVSQIAKGGRSIKPKRRNWTIYGLGHAKGTSAWNLQSDQPSTPVPTSSRRQLTLGTTQCFSSRLFTTAGFWGSADTVRDTR